MNTERKRIKNRIRRFSKKWDRAFYSGQWRDLEYFNRRISEERRNLLTKWWTCSWCKVFFNENKAIAKRLPKSAILQGHGMCIKCAEKFRAASILQLTKHSEEHFTVTMAMEKTAEKI